MQLPFYAAMQDHIIIRYQRIHIGLEWDARERICEEAVGDTHTSHHQFGQIQRIYSKVPFFPAESHLATSASLDQDSLPLLMFLRP